MRPSIHTQSSNHNKPAINYNKWTISGVLLVATIGLSACQTTPTAPVMQRADASFETTGLGKTKVAAQRQALESAKSTCGRYQPIILSDKVVYNGVLDESTGRMVEQVGAVAGAVFGKSMPNMSRDDDYEYTIKFRCQ